MAWVLRKPSDESLALHTTVKLFKTLRRTVRQARLGLTRGLQFGPHISITGALQEKPCVAGPAWTIRPCWSFWGPGQGQGSLVRSQVQQRPQPVVLKPLLGFMVFRKNEEPRGHVITAAEIGRAPMLGRTTTGEGCLSAPYQDGAGPVSDQRLERCHTRQVKHLFPPLAFLPPLP